MLQPVLRELEYDRSNAASQVALRLDYRDRLRRGEKTLSFRDVGFKAYSQTDEDGILWYIFSLIGEKYRTCVELCCGDGIECNSANLIINHGWYGLLVDGNPVNIRHADAFYFSHVATRGFPPKVVYSWITRENVNDILVSHGFEGEVDLLTIDVDGMDYWIWKAISAVSPRVVVVEYNTSLGPKLCVSVPYDPKFNGFDHSVTCGMPDYAGASLSAMVKLGHSLGYRFVGVNRTDFNAFFVRNDLAAPFSDCRILDSFFSSHAQWCQQTRYPKIMALPWEDV